MKEQRLLTEAKKSRQTASPNASKSIKELKKKIIISWNQRTQRLLIEAKKLRQTASPNASKSIEELEKKFISRNQRTEIFDLGQRTTYNSATLLYGVRNNILWRILKNPNYFEEFLEILWRIRKKIVVRWILMKEGSKSMEKSRRFWRF